MATGAVVNVKTRAQLRANSQGTDADINSFVNFADDCAAQDGLTALAGGGQTGATALVTGINNVSTCATNGDSVKLPDSNIIGIKVAVRNGGAATLAVFPFLGDKINGGTADASVNQTTGVAKTYYLVSITEGVRNWIQI
jgi:hypothetical protein